MRQWRTISLAKNPGTLVRFTFHESAPGRICTGTERSLSPLPLHWATGAHSAGSGPSAESPGGRSCTRTGSVLSGVPLLGYAGGNENDSPEAEPDARCGATSPFVLSPARSASRDADLLQNFLYDALACIDADKI